MNDDAYVESERPVEGKGARPVSTARGLRGHRFGETHPQAKLTDAQVYDIKRDKRSNRQIAKEYGVSQSLISLIKQGKVWAHVD